MEKISEETIREVNKDIEDMLQNNALLTIEDMIKERRILVTCSYFGSLYRGIVTELVVRPDGRVHLIASDPRMLSEEQFK